MANKFTNFIFTDEGKAVLTKVLASKGTQKFGIQNVYTFTSKLTNTLVYTQISTLGPKQNKPVGTVTPQANDTVEMRIQIDNTDVTIGYNLQGIAIVGSFNDKNFVLGYVNANETTNVPPYDGMQAQTLALDVSVALSDTSVVIINTQIAGMLTVADYIALQKYIDQKDSTKADDSAAVHKTGTEAIDGVKTFLQKIVGSVTGNAGTADRVNTLAINASVTLSSLTNGIYLSTNASKTTSDKPGEAGESYVLLVESNYQRFTDLTANKSYFRAKNGVTWSGWIRFATADDLATVNSSATHKTGNETIAGIKTFTSTILGSISGNAGTATKLVTARTLSLTGDATGSVTFDGSANAPIPVTLASVKRTNTATSQDVLMGGTFTALDSLQTDEKGRVTGVNVKTLSLPLTTQPTNDPDIVHKTKDETVDGIKSFLKTINGSISGTAGLANKLVTAKKINGVNFDGTNDIRVDPIVQTVTTNIDVFTLKNGFYYYSNIAATNKPAGSSNYFVVEVTTAPNGLNGFMQVVDSNNNTWWNTLSAGKWAQWKSVANDALVAHLEGDETYKGNKTFTGTITTSKRLNSPALELIGEGGSAYVGFHGKDNASDYSSRIVDDTADLGLKVLNQSGTGAIPAALFANATLPYDLDAVTLGNYNLNSYNHTVVVSTRTSLTGSSPVTNSDGVNILDNAVIEYRKGATTAWATQVVTNLWDSMVYERSNKGGSWQPWTKLSNDADVVHKNGDTMTGSLTVPTLTVNNPINGMLSKEPVNLLFNTNFDNEMEGWTKHTANATIQTSITGEGYTYVRISAGSAPLTDNAYIEQILDNNIVGGTKTYTLSYESWSSSPNSAGAGAWIVETDSKGNEIKSSMVDFGAETNWTKHSQTFVTSADTTSMKIRFKLNRNKSNVSAGFAKLQLEPTAVVGPYVRGSEIQDLSGFVSKAGGTMTGRLINNSGFQAGGIPASGESGSQIGGNGNIELSAVTPYIDFHANNSATDYTTRIWDQGSGLLATANGQTNILTQILANASNPINIDTMVGGLPALTGVGQSVRVQIDNVQPTGTIPAGLSNWSVLTHYATNNTTAWQEIWDISTRSVWRRTKSGNPSKWSGWQRLAFDNDVVHKTGDTLTGGINLIGNNGLTGGTNILGATGDLNDLKTTGLYNVGQNAQATGWTNRPANTNNMAFWVQVDGNPANSVTHQWYYENAFGGIWTRVGYLDGTNYTWKPWKQVAMTDSSITGNSATASKLATARTISLSGNAATGSASFDGSGNLVIPANQPVTVLSSTTDDVYNLATGLYYVENAAVQNKPVGSNNYGVIQVSLNGAKTTDFNGFMLYTDTANNMWWNVKSAGKWIGWKKTVSSEEIVESANKLANARTVKISGDATGSFDFDGSSDVSMPLTLSPVSRLNTTSGLSSTYGDTFTTIDAISTDAKGRVTGINTKSVTLPAAPTNITGNAGTATKLHTTRAIGVSGDATGSVPFDGSSNATMPLTLASVSRTNTTSSQSAKSGDTFTVIDSVSTDSKGRTTGVNTKSVKLPNTAMPSNDDDLLHKSGSETITGKKSFSGGIDMTSMHATGNVATDSDFHGSLTGNSRMHMRIDIQAYEYTAKGLTFRFIKSGPTAFVNISGNVSQDITSEETLITLGEGSNAKTYAQPYWAGGETTGYKGSAISAGQTGNLSIWDDGSVKISYRGPKVPKGTWLDGSITYISDSPLPADTIATNS